MYRRSLSCVEHLALYKGLIRIYTHFTAKGIDFSYKMTFTCSSYGRITRHHCYGFKIYGKYKSHFAHSCRGKSCFTSCVACAHNYNIIISKFISHHFFLRLSQFYFPRQNLLNTSFIISSATESPVISPKRS